MHSQVTFCCCGNVTSAVCITGKGRCSAAESPVTDSRPRQDAPPNWSLERTVQLLKKRPVHTVNKNYNYNYNYNVLKIIQAQVDGGVHNRTTPTTSDITFRTLSFQSHKQQKHWQPIKIPLNLTRLYIQNGYSQNVVAHLCGRSHCYLHKYHI